jgi:hypothetical protein
VCQLLYGANDTPFLETFVTWLSSILEGYVRICTTSGQINFNNVSIVDSPFMQVFPSGRYLAVFTYADDLDENVLQINASVVLTK